MYKILTPLKKVLKYVLSFIVIVGLIRVSLGFEPEIGWVDIENKCEFPIIVHYLYLTEDPLLVGKLTSEVRIEPNDKRSYILNPWKSPKRVLGLSCSQESNIKVY
jgi:hypothetical protein